MTEDEFKSKIEENLFLEWEEVYKNSYYGTLKSEVDRIWNNGNHILFDVDVEGGVNLKQIFDEQALSVFVMPPSIEELQHRLEMRGTDSSDKMVPSGIYIVQLKNRNRMMTRKLVLMK